MVQRILVGAGSHAESVLNALDLSDPTIYVFLDDDEEKWGTHIEGVLVAGGIDLVTELRESGATEFLVTVGHTPAVRHGLYARFVKEGLTPFSVLHPKADVSKKAAVGNGSVVLSNAVVGPSAQLGSNVIINSGSIVEHHVKIGHSSHVAPGATVLGGASVGNEVTVGAGAVVLPNVRVGNRSTIGAAACVLDDVPPQATVVGVPAKIIGSD